MTNNKYLRLVEALERNEIASMKCFGNSMLPILTNPSTCFYMQEEFYDVGDIVFCKVKGRFIDAHKITKCSRRGPTNIYMIANNHGHENGWSDKVFGRVFKAGLSNGEMREFKKRG